MKGSIHQEGIITLNIYAPNIRGPKYTKQILTDWKGEKTTIIIIVQYFSTLLSIVDRSYRQKINKVTLGLNYTLDQIILTECMKHSM